MDISRKMATYIKNQTNHPSSVDVLTFGIAGFINTIGTMFSLFIVGILFNRLIEIIILSCSFAILRYFTGGAHFNTSWLCGAATTILFLLITYIPLDKNISCLLLILSLAIIKRYSYYLEPYQSQRALKNRRTFSALSYLWIAIGFLLLLTDYFAMFTLGVLLQSLTITPYGIKLIHWINNIILKGGENK